MKKIILSIMALSAVLVGSAEGYQVNTLSAKQGGMAHTGVSQKLGSESMYFNPAGMAFMNKTLDISGSINGVSPSAKAKVDGTWYNSDNKTSTPLMVTAGFNIYDNLKAGIALYTPYGSSINWGENWPGAVLNQKVNLVTYTIQPTVSWRITPKLSIGAGLMMAWGNVDLYKGLVVPSTLDKVLAMTGQDYRFGNTTPASVNLNGTADVAWGVNVGVMYDISSKVTVGANFRSKMTMKVKSGTASLSYANEIARNILGDRLDIINSSNFSASMPMPAVITFGASYTPVDRLLLAFDAQFTNWKTYKDLDITFLDDKLTGYNQHLTKNYHNAWAFRLGGKYELTNRFDLRAGFIVDLSPVDINHYNPETPGMTKLEPSLGFSFRPLPSLSIDLSALYVAGMGKDGAKCTYEDLLAKTMGADATRTFTADYRVHAWSLAFGMSYSF